MGEKKGSSSGYFVVSSHQHAREVSGAVRDNIIRGDNLVLGQVSADEFRPGNRVDRGGRGGVGGVGRGGWLHGTVLYQCDRKQKEL